MPSIDAISFDDSKWELEADRDDAKVWHNEYGDGLGVYFFPMPPDIPAAPSEIDTLRDAYRRMATDSGSAIIEVDTVTLDGILGLKVIIKYPQDPSGMTYLGTITLPFREFSYVFKIQCQEHGTTGVREAFIADLFLKEKLQKNRGSGDEKPSGLMDGWAQDPYDPSFRAPLLRNLADDERHDDQFPDHPLSRLRRQLSKLQTSLTVTPEVKKLPGFSEPLS